jgi:MiaB-like tRNA modifying enzyme
MHIFVKNYGCSTNLADGQVLAGCLSKAGYKLSSSASTADIIIYNTCAVKGPTENRIIDALKRAPQNKKIIVTGCLTIINFERLRREVNFDGALGPAAGEKIANVVNRVIEGEKIIDVDATIDAKPSLSLPQLRSNPVISVLPINYGCLGSCTYCCVVFARGYLRSYTPKEITQRVEKDLTAGIKEFWITSQDTACYGRDISTNLATLLKVLDNVEGNFRVRVGMMTPNLAKDITDDLIEAFKSKKVFKFVHLPVQSGDHGVLKRMRRFYTVQDFRVIVDAFRATFPKITIATDIICGFPGENREAFENTLKLIEKVKPDIVNVSKFYVRPHTTAAKMHGEFVKLGEIKRRSTAAATLVKRISLERNQHWNGWNGEILIDEKGKIPNSWIGRNYAYKPIAIKSNENLLGKTLRVKIVKAFSTYLSGTIC